MITLNRQGPTPTLARAFTGHVRVHSTAAKSGRKPGDRSSACGFMSSRSLPHSVSQCPTDFRYQILRWRCFGRLVRSRLLGRCNVPAGCRSTRGFEVALCFRHSLKATSHRPSIRWAGAARVNDFWLFADGAVCLSRMPPPNGPVGPSNDFRKGFEIDASLAPYTSPNHTPKH